MKTNWNLDTMHSDVHFKVKHLVISTVTGTFSKYDVKVTTDGDDFSTARIIFTADVNSITTGTEYRDTHLKSADFFDAVNHPTVDFVSTAVKKLSESEYAVSGDLTMRGVTKPIVLDVEFGGVAKDAYGNIKAGFEVKTKFKRKEFGLNWDAVTEAGNIVVSDEVKLEANIQFVKVTIEEKAIA